MAVSEQNATDGQIFYRKTFAVRCAKCSQLAENDTRMSEKTYKVEVLRPDGWKLARGLWVCGDCVGSL